MLTSEKISKNNHRPKGKKTEETSPLFTGGDVTYGTSTCKEISAQITNQTVEKAGYQLQWYWLTLWLVDSEAT